MVTGNNGDPWLIIRNNCDQRLTVGNNDDHRLATGNIGLHNPVSLYTLVVYQPNLLLNRYNQLLWCELENHIKCNYTKSSDKLCSVAALNIAMDNKQNTINIPMFHMARGLLRRQHFYKCCGNWTANAKHSVWGH